MPFPILRLYNITPIIGKNGAKDKHTLRRMARLSGQPLPETFPALAGTYKIREVLRIGRRSCNPSGKLKPPGKKQKPLQVQALAKGFIECKVPVKIIAEDGMPKPREVNANLVHAPGIRHKLQKRELIAQTLPQGISCARLLLYTMHANAFRYFALRLAQDPPRDSEIGFFRSGVRQNTPHTLRGGAASCHDKASGGIAVKAVYEIGLKPPERLQFADEVGPNPLARLDRQPGRLINNNPIPAFVQYIESTLTHFSLY
jgi:hypothetical protein